MGHFADRAGMGFGAGMGAILGALADIDAEIKSGNGAKKVSISVEELKDLEEYKEAYRETLKNLEMTAANYEDALKSAENVVNLLRSRIEQKTKEYEALAKDREEVLKKYGDLVQNYKSLKGEYHKLEQEHALVSQGRDELQRRHDWLEQKYEKLMQSYQSLRSGREQERQEHEAQVQRLQSESQAEQDVLRRQLVEVEKGFGLMAQKYKDLNGQHKSVKKESQELRRWHAANLALRCAIEVQLLRSDPDNPVLVDQDLRERVRRAGEMAVTLLGEQASDPNAPDPFDMAREAGLTFAIPGRPRVCRCSRSSRSRRSISSAWRA